MAGAAAGTLVGLEALGKVGSFFGDLLKELNEIVLYSDDVITKTEYKPSKGGKKKTVTKIVHRKITLLEVLIGLIIAKIIVWDEMGEKPIWNPISGVAPPYAAGGLIGWLVAIFKEHGDEIDWSTWGESSADIKKWWKSIDWGSHDMADTTAGGGGGGVAPGAGGHRGGA